MESDPRSKITEIISRINPTRVICAVMIIVLIISAPSLILLLPDPNSFYWMPPEGINWTGISMYLLYLAGFGVAFLGLFGVIDLGD